MPDIRKLFKNLEKGQGLVEYAVILVLAAVVVIATMFGCIALFIIPIAIPWLERVLAAANDGSTGAWAQLICVGVLLVSTFTSCIPRLSIRIRSS